MRWSSSYGHSRRLRRCHWLLERLPNHNRLGLDMPQHADLDGTSPAALHWQAATVMASSAGASGSATDSHPCTLWGPQSQRVPPRWRPKTPSGLDPQQRRVTTLCSPFQRPQHWHSTFVELGRGSVGPFGFSRLWLLPTPSRGLAHQAEPTVPPPHTPGNPTGRPFWAACAHFHRLDSRKLRSLSSTLSTH
jgi:hypothetical protein